MYSPALRRRKKARKTDQSVNRANVAAATATAATAANVPTALSSRLKATQVRSKQSFRSQISRQPMQCMHQPLLKL